uniref:ABC transmembrane type-1 domain-containing protein n=1 Tax=Timema monikensis TaxID=170555 RepID=A0A7R9HQ19_9NEOP|nr:unnamed protein product [Timema monikensis]
MYIKTNGVDYNAGLMFRLVDFRGLMFRLVDSRGLMFRIVDFRVLMFRLVDLIVIMLRLVDFRVLMFRLVDFRVLMFRLVDFRVLMFRLVDFRVLMFRLVDFRVIMFRLVDIRVLMFRLVDFRVLMFRLALTSFIMLLFTIDFGVTAHRSSQGYEVFPVDLLAPVIRVVTLRTAVEPRVPSLSSVGGREPCQSLHQSRFPRVRPVIPRAGTSNHNNLAGDIVTPANYTERYSPLEGALSAALQYYNRKKGLRTSGLLFIFWFFTALFGAVQFRHEIRRSQYEFRHEIRRSQYEVSPLGVQARDKEVTFLNVCLQSPQVHPDPYYQSDYAPVEATLYWRCRSRVCGISRALVFNTVLSPPQNPCPIMRAPYHSRLFFSWFDPFVWKGYRSPIRNVDLWGLTPEETSREIVPSFNKYWEKTLDKASRKHTPEARFSRNSGRMDFVKTTKKIKKPSVLLALVKAFGPTFLFGSILLFCVNVLTFVSPQLLKYLIAFVSSDDPMWKGYMYASMMFIAAALQTMFNSQYSYKMMVVGIRIRVALISVIYKKALSMSNSARKESTVGEIVNLMSVDANRILEAVPNLNILWSAPMLIALCLYFLWEIMGPSVLAGLAVMVVLIPINGFIANKVKNLQIQQMKTKDQRIKLMNEVLNGIKVLKMYAWEPSFEKIIESKRGKEIKVLKAAAYLNAGTSFIWTCAPFMVSLMTFMTFILVDSSNVLERSDGFCISHPVQHHASTPGYDTNGGSYNDSGEQPLGLREELR